MSKVQRRKIKVNVKDTGLKVSAADLINFNKGVEATHDTINYCSYGPRRFSKFDCLKRYFDLFNFPENELFDAGWKYQLATEMYRVDHEAAVRDKIPAPISIKRAVGL